jgi:hypothetical protein
MHDLQGLLKVRALRVEHFSGKQSHETQDTNY